MCDLVEHIKLIVQDDYQGCVRWQRVIPLKPVPPSVITVAPAYMGLHFRRAALPQIRVETLWLSNYVIYFYKIMISCEKYSELILKGHCWD